MCRLVLPRRQSLARIHSTASSVRNVKAVCPVGVNAHPPFNIAHQAHVVHPDKPVNTANPAIPAHEETVDHPAHQPALAKNMIVRVLAARLARPELPVKMDKWDKWDPLVNPEMTVDPVALDLPDQLDHPEMPVNPEDPAMTVSQEDLDNPVPDKPTPLDLRDPPAHPDLPVKMDIPEDPAAMVIPAAWVHQAEPVNPDIPVKMASQVNPEDPVFQAKTLIIALALIVGVPTSRTPSTEKCLWSTDGIEHFSNLESSLDNLYRKIHSVEVAFAVLMLTLGNLYTRKRYT